MIPRFHAADGVWQAVKVIMIATGVLDTAGPPKLCSKLALHLLISKKIQCNNFVYLHTIEHKLGNEFLEVFVLQIALS